MVAAVPEGPPGEHARPKTSAGRESNQISGRLPFQDNGICTRKPKAREISSRYLASLASTSSSSSSSSSRRFPSPPISRVIDGTATSATSPMRASTCLIPKRPQSADRRRSVTPRPTTPLPGLRSSNASELSAYSKLKFTSTRSLSVSFQGETFSLPISKTKVAQPENLDRKSMPERRKTTTPTRGRITAGDRMENAKPVDQRWPGKVRQSNALSMSLDLTSEKKVNGSRTSFRSSKPSGNDDEGIKASFDGSLSFDLKSANVLGPQKKSPGVGSLSSGVVASDTDSSDSTSGVHERGSNLRGRFSPSDGTGSVRSWQERATSRQYHPQNADKRASMSPGSIIFAPPRLASSKLFLSEGPSPPSKRASSPLKEVSRPASPSRFLTSSFRSPSRRNASPSRVSSSISGCSNSGHTPTILSFSVDNWRGKLGDNQISRAHVLRVLHNRYLQWRFINARAESTAFLRTLRAERSLWSASACILELLRSVRGKRMQLQSLGQKMKLSSVLRRQMMYLEEWLLMEREHSSCLTGTIQALNSCILSVPVMNVKADIQRVKDAFGSAVPVMQALASSTSFMTCKVEELNALITQLSRLVAVELSLLNQCRDSMSSLQAMQIRDSHLRAHQLQHLTDH